MGSQAPQRPTPEQERKTGERPISPPPPPPPYLLREDKADVPKNRRPVTVTPGTCKGGRNPDNTSDARPEPPQGSGGPSANVALATSIGNCARCGESHRLLVFRVFMRGPIETATGLATHWASCPTNGEPILMRAETDD